MILWIYIWYFVYFLWFRSWCIMFVYRFNLILSYEGRRIMFAAKLQQLGTNCFDLPPCALCHSDCCSCWSDKGANKWDGLEQLTSCCFSEYLSLSDRIFASRRSLQLFLNIRNVLSGIVFTPSCDQALLNGSCTFKWRLEDWCGFEGEEQFLSVLAERSTLLGGHDELANETRPITDVVILVVFGQVENILRQQFGLFEEGI